MHYLALPCRHAGGMCEQRSRRPGTQGTRTRAGEQAGSVATPGHTAADQLGAGGMTMFGRGKRPKVHSTMSQSADGAHTQVTPEDSPHYAQAIGWEASRTLALEQSERRAWRVAGAFRRRLRPHGDRHCGHGKAR